MERSYKVFNYTARLFTDFKFDNPFTGQFAQAFDNFLEYYSPDLIVPSPQKKLLLSKKTDRVCRFCDQNSSSTSFRKISHVMPKLMGNNYLIHDCECDSCNEKFGLYEDSLAKYIGMMRTADRLKGYSGVPKFKSADGNLEMTLEKDENGIDVVSISYKSLENFIKNDESVTLKTVKQSYTPLHVMKSLYKIGYSFLKSDELHDYKLILKILNTNVLDTKLSNFARIVKFTFPKSLKEPFAITYKKKEDYLSKNIPTKIIVLHFGRYAYQYFLPNIKDRFMFTDGEQCEWIFTPPYYLGDQNEISMQRTELSSNVLRKGEVDTIFFKFDNIALGGKK